MPNDRDSVAQDVRLKAEQTFGQYVRCSRCGKRVSQYVNVEGDPSFAPAKTKALIIRAWVECPECIQSAHGINKGR